MLRLRETPHEISRHRPLTIDQRIADELPILSCKWSSKQIGYALEKMLKITMKTLESKATKSFLVKWKDCRSFFVERKNPLYAAILS